MKPVLKNHIKTWSGKQAVRMRLIASGEVGDREGNGRDERDKKRETKITEIIKLIEFKVSVIHG
ncbi:hypothetical protein OkiPb00166_48640 [Escherichia coli]